MSPRIDPDVRARRAVPVWLLVIGALLILAGSALAVTGASGPSGPIGKAAYGEPTKCPKASHSNGQQQHDRELCQLNKKHDKALSKCKTNIACINKANKAYNKALKKLNKRWSGLAKCDKKEQKDFKKAAALPPSKQQAAYTKAQKKRAKCGKKVKPKK